MYIHICIHVCMYICSACRAKRRDAGVKQRCVRHLCTHEYEDPYPEIYECYRYMYIYICRGPHASVSSSAVYVTRLRTEV